MPFDAFGNDISARTNVLDLPAHYPYSPERWRLFVDGSRVFPEYGSVSQYTHNTDTHDLSPAAGETVTFSTTGSYVPILAVRVDPDRAITNVQLSDLRVLEYSGSGDVKLVVKSHAPSNVLDSGGNELVDSDFDAPGQQITQNSVVEVSAAVEQAPDNTGTSQTSTADTGGYQIGWSTFAQVGSGSNTRSTTTASDVKRELSGRDVAVVWGNADNAETVAYELRAEQDW